MSWLKSIVLFADRREPPDLLAMVRICLGLVLLFDMASIAYFDLVIPLFGSRDIGGFSDSIGRENGPLMYQYLPASPLVARAHFSFLVIAAVSLTTGFYSRTSAAFYLLASAQFEDVMPLSDRGIDLLVRNVLMVLAFSPCGAAWSIDAKAKTGKWAGDGAPQPAWARYILILQLVVMYFTAGVQKTGVHWWPIGWFAALYLILQDPAIARFDFGWLENQPFFFSTQVGTAVTVLFQCTYPLVLLWLFYRETPERPGKLRAFANRWHLEWWWIGVGAFFHFALFATTELGIFPWAMLAIYPVFLEPERFRRLVTSSAQPEPDPPSS